MGLQKKESGHILVHVSELKCKIGFQICFCGKTQQSMQVLSFKMVKFCNNVTIFFCKSVAKLYFFQTHLKPTGKGNLNVKCSRAQNVNV